MLTLLSKLVNLTRNPQDRLLGRKEAECIDHILRALSDSRLI